MIRYRTMKAEDIAEGLKLCRIAKWNQLETDWQLFLQLSPQTCLVACHDGQVVGTVTTIHYKHLFSWIGMVLVHPNYRRQGIGMHLLKQSLQVLNLRQTVKLDATPTGREVYLKLGFEDEFQLSRMYLLPKESKFTKTRVRPILKKDLPSVVDLDHKIFGADRSALLERMYENAPQFGLLLEEENQIKGFIMGRRGHDFNHLGPIIAQDNESAKELLKASLQTAQGHPLIVDVMHNEPEWIAWLLEMGFKEQRQFVRMFRGKNHFPGAREKQFAIIGPEFG